MIQLLASMPAGGDLQTPLVAPSADSASASFLSLFAQALRQGAATETAALAAQPSQGLPAPAAGKLADAIVLAVPQAANAGANVSEAARADIGAAADVILAAVSGTDTEAASPDVAPPAAATPPDAMAQAVLAMLGIQAPSQPAAPPPLAQVDADPAAEGDDDGVPAGKKLPNPVAVLAVQHRAAEAIQQRGEASPAELMARPFGAAETATLVATELPAAKEVSAANATAPLPVAGQEALHSAVRAHEPASAKLTLAMQAAPGSAAWRQELCDKLIWMTGRQGQMAELILNPPSLGAVEVRLNLSGTDASAQFFAANPQVRDAIEAALPKLRELMGSAGIALGEAMVSDQSFGQRDKADQGRASGHAVLAKAGAADRETAIEKMRVTGTALLDYFA